MREKVEKELRKLEDQGIIERVKRPTPWVSPIVVVPKPRNPDEIRICVDMRQPNKAIIRERHPSPTIDDIIAKVNGSTKFSKIDLKSGYHQLPLAEESRYITIFSTHNGLWRYKRLNFGICSASEKFQHIVSEVISDIEGAINISDDIFIFGLNTEIHDKYLHEVLTRLNSNGLTANLAKCEFNKERMEFFGLIFSKHGVEVDPKKVKAVTDMNEPSNVTEIQSFLGITNYCSRFIKKYSTITEPLRQLTHKGVEFIWGKEHTLAFETLKQALANALVMAYFNVHQETELIVDASPVGLGAMLVQYYTSDDGKRIPRIVSYGTRALTAVEQRYKSQLEREALAILWACEHFHVYIYGAQITVVTDHKPLVTLFGNANASLPSRLERWALRLLPYNPSIVFRKGRDNPADYLSRHPVSIETSSRKDLVSEEYVNFIETHSIPKAVTLYELKTATKEDATLQSLIELISSQQWHLIKVKFAKSKTVDIDELLAFRKIATELTVSNYGLILKGTKWSHLAADFYGPLPSGEHLLVVIDEYSTFPEVEIIRSLAAKTVIPVLDKLFSSRGIPDKFKTDNGPPFNGDEFKTFARGLGFKHQRITPCWPEANGCAERFMKTIGKVCKCAQVEGKSWKKELYKFLRNYRATPHTSTGIPPATIANGKSLKTKLPQIPKVGCMPEVIHDKLKLNDKQ
ncbi:uncharacterized protein K02A2.6-like [Anneissia japonica]|uniref:uncharacterized protein K02A2.6-like n=1 Tax=Anneissia japonica TaxID=1529436 RepID=UPI001425A5DA|nr:uncharacterized protein K02A2.6-like [Anneissia japonica]